MRGRMGRICKGAVAPLGVAGRDHNAVDGASTEEEPADDVGAFNVGFAGIGEIPATPAAG